MKSTSNVFLIPQTYLPCAKQKSLFFSLKILHNTEIRGFRVLFGKPANGQRTIANGKTAKNLLTSLYKFKFNSLKALSKIVLTKPIFIAEYVNLYWQQQYIFEWVSVANKRKRLPVYLRNTNYIDIANMNNFYIYNMYNNPFKRKIKIKQRRKKTTPKNKYATGFPFGFSFIFWKQLNAIN